MLDDQIHPTRRTRIGFNSDWLFCRGDGSNDSTALSYERLRDAILPTGNYLRGAGSIGLHRKGRAADIPTPPMASREFDDATWTRVTVPHDYAIAGPFAIELPGETGKLPWAGVAWYRKHFRVEPLREAERLILELDGAMSFSSIWLNGKLVGGWPYGYTSYQLDLTEYLDPSGDNVLAVRLDNPGK
ncbi:MAG: beta galactosidase jelly roll domain-containing protein [Polyangiaceae bacterium]